jgi:pyruvate/2-oxoglutarate dehydrogenase complex dihydrolipoamide dehydrogenase (E3) component
VHGKVEKNEATESDWKWDDLLPSFMRKDSDAMSYQPAMAEPSMIPLAAVPHHSIDEESGIDTFGVAPLDEYNREMLDNVHPVKWVNPTPKKKYNLVAIGAGAGGLVSCAGTAGLGGVTAIVEENLFGGDCLVSGCVPSKALLASAHAASIAIKRAEEFGLKIEGTVSVDFGKVMQRMRAVRAKISHHDACSRFTKVYGMDVFLGRAEFISPTQIRVSDGSVLEFARAVVATGATPTAPPIDGLSEVDYLTNHTVWNLTEQPKRLAVIGAGPIGCELGQAFALLGSEVTMMNRSDRVLGKEDIEAADVVREKMTEDGCQFLTGVTFKRVYYTDGAAEEKGGDEADASDSAPPSAYREIAIELEITSTKEPRTILCDALLVATGRKPNVKGCGLAKAGIKFNESTGVEVNDFLQTTNSNVYAVGDCCTRFQFTHMADAMARIVIKNACFFGRSKVSDLVVPWCTYTMPEVAHVGLYEGDLETSGTEFDVHKVDLSHNDRAICEGDEYGFVKVLCKKGTDSILGATIVSKNAGDQISELTLAIQANVGLGFVAGVIHPYPTIAEGIKQCGDSFNRTKLTPLSKGLLRRILSARR